jgi:hypothetical protein
MGNPHLEISEIYCKLYYQYNGFNHPFFKNLIYEYLVFGIELIKFWMFLYIYVSLIRISKITYSGVKSSIENQDITL